MRKYCPIRKAHYNRHTRYRLSPEDYAAMLHRQKGVCAICKRAVKLSVDHEHKKKKRVRGLLCTGCNLLLGHARENITILIAAIRYLRKHK
jgi:hypothetical protein